MVFVLVLFIKNNSHPYAKDETKLPASSGLTKSEFSNPYALKQDKPDHIAAAVHAKGSRIVPEGETITYCPGSEKNDLFLIRSGQHSCYYSCGCIDAYFHSKKFSGMNRNNNNQACDKKRAPSILSA